MPATQARSAGFRHSPRRNAPRSAPASAVDVQMYSFVIPTLIATWGIMRGHAVVLGTAALLASACGGWIMPAFPDDLNGVKSDMG